MSQSLLEVGATVWRTAVADRIGFLVDGEDYFAAVADAVSRARESVLILAWSIDSKVRLFRGEDDDERPPELAAFLSWALGRRPELEIRVLCWDFSAIYTFERELLQRARMGWTTHDRLHFSFDDNHPAGASLHEKIVVVDDRVAFVGGFDLGRRRWDTSKHAPEDERRITPSGNSYPPFHDVQAVVEGEIAAVLGELARERWRRATGEEVAAASTPDDPWPRGVAAAIRDLEVGIVRTRPEHQDQDPVVETEEYLRRLIGRAERFIYAENQYLTSDAIAEALADRLAGDDPPEVVLVTARENHGWLEQAVMGGLRESFRRKLGDADHSGRLRIYYPEVGEGVTPNVHSKVMVVDDRWAYVGSANLSNRSMGLDSECGLAIDWDGRDDVGRALRELRIRLVSEHLGVDPDELAAREAEAGPVAAVESLRGGARTLEELDTDDRELTSTLEPVARLADPHRPVKLADLVDMIHELL